MAFHTGLVPSNSAEKLYWSRASTIETGKLYARTSCPEIIRTLRLNEPNGPLAEALRYMNVETWPLGAGTSWLVCKSADNPSGRDCTTSVTGELKPSRDLMLIVFIAGFLCPPNRN